MANFWKSRNLMILSGCTALILGIIGKRVSQSQKTHQFMYLCGQKSREIFIDTTLKVSSDARASLIPFMGERDCLVLDDGYILVHYSDGNYVLPIEPNNDLSEQNKKATLQIKDFHNYRHDNQLKIAIADDGTLPPDELFLRQWYV